MSERAILSPRPLSQCEDCRAVVFARRGGHPPQRMEHSLDCRRIDARPCEWCGGPVLSKQRTARTCGDRCRAYLHRFEHRIGQVHDRGRSGRNARSGFQVSLRKAEDVLAGWLRQFDDYRSDGEAERAAHLILKGALSERQRARLEARES